MREKILPHTIGTTAYAATVGIQQLIELITQKGLEIPVHRKNAEYWMEDSPYFVVFDYLEEE